MDIKIKRAKVGRAGCVEVSFIDPEGNEITMKGKNRCHPDLRNAFRGLVPFFADLTELKEADFIDWGQIDSVENADLLKKIDVTGLNIGGDVNNKIVTLTGNRSLRTSRILNINSPGVEMDSETFEWEHIDDFDIAVQEVIYEVKEYIVNRKWEVEQKSLFEGDPDDPFGETTPTDDTAPIEDLAESVA